MRAVELTLWSMGLGLALAICAAESEALESPRVFRVILPAGDLEASVRFYRELLAMDGERVNAGRHYFTLGNVILAIVDPVADGDEDKARPNADHVYLAVEDPEPYHRRAAALEALSPAMGSLETRPWGERSFYLEDPFGNPLCFVDEKTLYLGPGYRPSIPDGAFFQVILEVSDLRRQAAFYRDTLGLHWIEPEGVTDVSDQSFVRFATPGASLALHARTEPGPPAAPARLSFMTHDIVGRRKGLLERKIEMGPIRHPAPGVLVTDGRDPEGNIFHIETRVDARSVTREAESEARKAFDALVEAYVSRKWDVYLGFYADDPRFHLYEKGRTLYTSKAEVEKAIRDFYPAVSEASFTPSSSRIVAVSDCLALVTTEFEQRLVLREGSPLAFSGTMYLLLERGAEGFRILTGDTIPRD